jgi:hypothetical protein
MTTNSPVKFAFLVMYEMRCLKHIDKIYKNIIDFYNADVIICCQNVPEHEDDINLFDRNVVYKNIYTKPDPNIYFNNNKYLHIESQNWNKPSCLQIYINWNEMGKVLEEFKDKYDYFINIRTDIDILFPFPDKQLFENIPKGVYTYNAEYSKCWGGFGCGVFMHRDYIIEYLTSTYNILINEDLCNNLSYMNQEKFLNYCLLIYGIEMKYIKNLNIIYIAKSENAYTTWAIPQKHPLYEGYVKYSVQLEETLKNLELWNKGYKWKVVNNSIELI